ncbi:Rieske (2Fe-2S) protein [Acuticoccus mangrovi]|uniref:Rieske (2Fe-2S) protein n=1 Tax=Acuticoccus mangrovi TaxID=2796142 RepID=A0A934IKE9_9HYPH|nr:Rieske (2Fe-2S) protein [Acuticoccus mangrovi]MBJ3778128.1 Rieske (2Fe-2S) protein [Acuticoccus mangrovi]
MPGVDETASWFPLMGSGALRAGGLQPVRLGGYPIVVWRSASGKLSVWRDRCPHRGMRLSFGEVQGETVLCPYHGWSFGADTQCKFIPAHPELKPPRAGRAEAFEAEEAAGFIWARAPLAGGRDVPAVPDATAGFVPLRSLSVGMDADETLAALIETPLVGPLALDPEGGAVLGADHAVIAVPLAPGRTMVHLTVSEAMAADERAALVAALRRFRFAHAPAA